MAFAFASPNRVLDNIKRLELQEAELPSLPSIQPNFDYDSGMDTSQGSTDMEGYKPYEHHSEQDIATPHPTRRAFTPATATQIAPPASDPNLTTSTSASPFPPIRTSPTGTESPYIPNRAATSTPHSAYSRSRRFVSDDTRSTARHTQTYTLGHSRNRSDTDEIAGNNTGRERWHTPGEMSGSFSVEGIEAGGDVSPSLPGGGQLGSERSVPLRDDSYNDSVQAETPLTQRLHKSHVVLQRPGRRSHLAQSYIHDAEPHAEQRDESPSSPSAQGGLASAALVVPVSDRVPSLSRSEVSATDASEAASTPEGPSRRVIIAARGSPRFNDEILPEELPSDLPENPTYDYQAESSHASSSAASYNNTPAPVRHASPYKPRADLSSTPFSQMSIPGMARDPAVGRSEYHDSLIYQGATPTNPLRDMTEGYQAQATPLTMPYTPLPIGMTSKTSDFSTPRAPLDDAERRKNHVLAVLSSSGIPARDRRTTRGTPRPLRQISASPRTESIREDGSPSTFPSLRRNRESTPASFSHFDIDRSASAPPNESFVSVASSADLTTDRRGTAQPRFSRANISFPTILLPTHHADTSTPGGGSLRGMDNHRADGVKIHKHLNAMNKQLLETNSELAREAEGWRDEVGRLMRLLEEAGVEVEEVDVMANVSRRSGGGSFAAEESGTASGRQSSVGMTSEQNVEIIQELAEKLEGLEEILNEKDAQIVELEDEVEALRQGGGGGDDDRLRDLEDQLEEAERTRQILHSDFAAKTEQHAKRFGEICSGFEEQVGGLEAELANARKEVERLRAEKDRLERIADSTSAGAREMELGKQVQALGIELDRVRADLQEKQKEVDQLRVDGEGAEGQLAELEHQLADKDTGPEVQTLQEEVARLNQELEDALDRAAEVEQMSADIEHLNAIIEDKETELEALQGRLEVAEIAAMPLRQSINNNSPAKSATAGDTDAAVSLEDQASFVAAIEDRLDEAYREIGRLKHELSSTPHRKTTIEAKDAKIRALEQEKAALLSRVSPAKSSAVLSSQTPRRQAMGTPTPAGRPTPFVHKAIASLRMPNTPGPLKELSWLNTTIGDANETIYRAQIGNLHEELNHVNQQLDDNFARLEAAGMGGIELAEKLAAAQQRISDLEDEIRALIHRNKASLALVHAQRKENAQESEDRLQAALSAVHSQLDDLRSEAARERKRLQSDVQRMREAKTSAEEQLENEINNMRIDVNDAIDAANSEVEQAKQDAITVSTEAAALHNELQTTKAEVKSTTRRIAALQRSLDDQKHRHSRELSSKVSSQDLTDKIAEIDRLKGVQRDSEDRIDRLSNDLREKDSALARAEERTSDLMAERATVRAEMEDFERDLNVQKEAARRLKSELRALNDRQAAVDGEKGEYASLKMEYDGVIRQLEGLKRREQDAHSVEQELSRVVREYKAVKGEMRVLERELRLVREERGELDQWKMSHVCESGTTQAMSDQKSRFKAQTRDLASQIQYLKAKCTRESTFRNGLALQKRYLLLLVGGMSLNEQATIKAIASFGFPMPEPPRRKITLKAVALAVVGLIRARNSAAAWKVEKELKAEAIANFGERRRVSGRE